MEETILCQVCENELDGSENYCPTCGSKIENEKKNESIEDIIRGLI